MYCESKYLSSPKYAEQNYALLYIAKILAFDYRSAFVCI